MSILNLEVGRLIHKYYHTKVIEKIKLEIAHHFTLIV